MAASNHQLFVFDNGRKIKDSKTLEVLVAAIAVSADGGLTNTLTIKEGTGGAANTFDFGGKALGNIGPGTVAGQALSYTQRGAANGVASLDSAGKVPAAELPNSIMEYAGSFNPSTHVPNLQNGGAAIKSGVVIQGLTYAADVAGAAGNLISLTYVDPAAPSQSLSVGVVGNAITVNLATDSGSLITSTADDVKAAIEGTPAAAALVDITGSGATALTAQAQTYLVGGADAANAGSVYKATAGGSHNFGAGAITFVTGDYAIYNASGVWELAHSGADAVISVNGQSGVVSLNTDNISEGTANFYYSTSLFDADLATKTTDNLSEGTTNKYFASGFSAATTDGLTEGTANLYFNGKTTDGLAEGTTNKYFASGFAAATTDGLTEGTANLYFNGKTTDGLAEGTANLYFNGKTTDALAEGTTNKYFASGFAAATTDGLTEGTTNKYFASGFSAATTDGLTEGTTNKYFSGKTTDDLPEGTTNKYFTGVPNYAAFVNKELSAITVGKFVKMTVAGEVTLLAAADLAINDETFFGCVKDASIAADGTGNVYLPEVGARVSGYSTLDVTKLVYATTAGGYTQTRPTTGKVIILGKPISASEIIFLGRFEAEYV